MDPNQPSSSALQSLDEAARSYAREAVPENTRRAYRADWEGFTAWCRDHDRHSMPASSETVILFLTALAPSHRISTLKRKAAAISTAHQLAGHSSPVKNAGVRLCLRGIARNQAAAGHIEHCADPLLLEDVLSMVRCTDETPGGLRDAALLLIGFAGGFRRSELVALCYEDLTWTKDGLIIRIRLSKTDQTGKGMEKAIPFGQIDHRCPVRRLERWIEAAGINSGPLFRRIRKGGEIETEALTAQSVNLIIRKWAKQAGIDAPRLSGHSLRAGFVTTALLAGASYPQVQKQTGHRSIATVTRYDRGRTQFQGNAVSLIGF